MLHAETSEFRLTLGSGLKNAIRVTGMKCINVRTFNLSAPTYIEPLNESIQIPTGKSAQISGEGTNNRVYCTNKDGSIPSDAHIGTLACLDVYINYTDMVTGQSNITYGKIAERYET